jgi:septal ring factor EnvC (AmiA/AmiB activator)
VKKVDWLFLDFLFFSLFFSIFLGITEARKYIARVKGREASLRLWLEQDIDKALKPELVISKNQAHNDQITTRLIRKGIAVAKIGQRKHKANREEEKEAQERAAQIETIKEQLDHFHVQNQTPPPAHVNFDYHTAKEKKSHLKPPSPGLFPPAGMLFF